MLNLGVSPRYLVELMRGKLAAAGGALLEQTGVSGAARTAARLAGWAPPAARALGPRASASSWAGQARRA